MTMAQPVQLPNLVGHAIAYARRGWPVFPLHTALGGGACSCGHDCGHPGKHPRTPNGLTDATTDEATIRGWWQAWPDASIAVAAGASGLVIVDIDPRSKGDATWSALSTSNDPIPLTPSVATGGGGSHIYLRAPSYPVASRANALGLGVDVKSSGGYVVAPPSMHASGNRYEWRQGANPGEADLADCPQWILDKLARKKARGVRPDSKLAAAFAAAGMLGKRLPDARWAVKCPWYASHSGTGQWRDGDSSTVLLPATSEHPRARFICSHAHCNGRSTGDVWSTLPRAAVEAAEEEWAEKPEPVADPLSETIAAPVEDQDWASGLIRKGKNHDGDPTACEHNALLILSHDPRWAGLLGWDAFGCVLRWRGDPPWSELEQPSEALGTWQDEDATRLVSWLHKNWQMRVSTVIAHGVAAVVGRRAQFHPVLDFLGAKKWDGIIRAEKWLTTYLGAEDTPYTRAVGARWLVSAVARVREPGCQADHMLVLEGPQGKRKSTALRTLCGAQWYTDRISDPANKDSAAETAGIWIGEFSDLATMRRADVESIKAFVTRRVDRYRPSYGRCVVVQPRQCVFAGTTNEDCYLGDATGARRFWPVLCGQIDVAAIERDRAQLWAEAMARYDSGERIWLDTEELVAAATEEQDARYVGDPWEGTVAEWLETSACQRLVASQGGITTSDVLGVLSIDTGRRSRADEMRCSALLRRLGWKRGRAQLSGRRCYRFNRIALPG